MPPRKKKTAAKPYVLFSKRDIPLPDVYQYDDLPEEFREQAIHLMRDLFGENGDISDDGQDYNYINPVYKYLCREHGKKQLGFHPRQEEQLREYIRKSPTPRCLDTIEYFFKIANVLHGEHNREARLPRHGADARIVEDVRAERPHSQDT